MALSDWLDKLTEKLDQFGATQVKAHTGTRHQKWILGKNSVILPSNASSSSGRGPANYEAEVSKVIALYLKDNPGLLERMEKERLARRKGMSPKDVERLIQVRGPKEPPMPVVVSPTPVAPPPLPVITVQPPPLVVHEEALDEALARAKEETRTYVDPVAPERIPVPEPSPLEFERQPLRTRLEEVPHMDAADRSPVAHSPMVEEEVTHMASPTPTMRRPGRGRPGIPRGTRNGVTKCPYCTREPFGAAPPLGRHVKNEHPEHYDDYVKNFTTNRPSQQRGKGPRVGLPDTEVQQPEPAVTASAGPGARRRTRQTKAEKMAGTIIERNVPPIDVKVQLMQALSIITTQIPIVQELVRRILSEHDDWAVKLDKLEKRDEAVRAALDHDKELATQVLRGNLRPRSAK